MAPTLRRLKDYAAPNLLLIDDVGYLSYSDRHADLLFELISRQPVPLYLAGARNDAAQTGDGTAITGRGQPLHDVGVTNALDGRLYLGGI
jgi:hypothetical protein